jgi:hypothetical protein
MCATSSPNVDRPAGVYRVQQRCLSSLGFHRHCILLPHRQRRHGRRRDRSACPSPESPRPAGAAAPDGDHLLPAAVPSRRRLLRGPPWRGPPEGLPLPSLQAHPSTSKYFRRRCRCHCCFQAPAAPPLQGWATGLECPRPRRRTAPAAAAAGRLAWPLQTLLRLQGLQAK